MLDVGDDSMVELPPAGFYGDFPIALEAESPGSLVAKIQQAAAIVRDVFAEFGLVINFSQERQRG